MDSERGPATAGPRIVYILSCGGLSVSALGLFPYSNFSTYYNQILGGDCCFVLVLKFTHMCLGYPIQSN